MRYEVKPDCVLSEPDIICLAKLDKYVRQRQNGYQMIDYCNDSADRCHHGAHTPKCYLAS